MLHPFIPLAPKHYRKPKWMLGQPTLQLLSVSYDIATSITLVFNQPIVTDFVDATMFMVNDPGESTLYQGYQLGTPPTPESLRIDLSPFDPSQQGGLWMEVQPANGVRTLDGTEWAGVNRWDIQS